MLTMSNGIKQQSTGEESNHIGLMSVEKMMQQLGGEFIFGGKWIVFCEIGVSFDSIWKS